MGLNPKIAQRNKFVARERKKIMAISDEKKRRATLLANFRNGGIIPVKGSKAEKVIREDYHAWLKANGHDLPKPKPPRKDGEKKKRRKSKKKKNSEKK